jgi:hypothetical protein
MVATRLASVRASLRGVLACGAVALAASLAFASPAAAECPNETVRQESNMNPTTGQPYSAGLPDCRGYEMVSPLYKQADSANELRGGLPVAPGGETAGWASEGSFSNPENWILGLNPYLSQRGGSEWSTSSAFAPRSLVDGTFASGIESDSSSDLRSVRVTCGSNPEEKGQRGTQSQFTAVCARREGVGSWTSTPGYREVHGEGIEGVGTGGYLGGSSDLSRLFIHPDHPLLPSDTVPEPPRGIYEIAGCCTSSSALRLVNVDKEGKQLVLLHNKEINGPLFGDVGLAPVLGSEYHAISQSGGTVFFTATPNNPEAGEEEKLTVYARINCGTNAVHSAPPCKEDGNGEWFETVAVSNPSHEECAECNTTPATRQNATFQGASADGSKVFFTTTQQLLSQEVGEGTSNLYEYDFDRPRGERLVLLSADKAGAKVEGVVRSAPDGSHVYFVAKGVLTAEEENGSHEKAKEGLANLYGYDTITKNTKFVAAAGTIVSGIRATVSGVTVSTDSARHAQTTPDGRYLVFSSPAKLAEDANTKGCPTNCPQAVYRYDFETGSLTWVSKGAAGFVPVNEGEGKDALVTPLPATKLGASANIDDWNRAISENGEYIIFTTTEKLQASDVNKALDVYEWHNGTVSMISDGRGPLTSVQEQVAMSASGSDIFFLTSTALVGQDTDALRDVYDARVGGGFPAPAAEPSCSDVCQGAPSAPPSFPSAASSLFSGGRNLSPPLISVASSVSNKPKALTRAQQLAKALKACKGKPKRKRVLCESQAKKKYGGTVKTKKSGRRRK